jgi:hypothetical protein
VSFALPLPGLPAGHLGGAIVAIQHDLNPTLITLKVGVDITLSFITLPAWWHVLHAT